MFFAVTDFSVLIGEIENTGNSRKKRDKNKHYFNRFTVLNGGQIVHAYAQHLKTHSRSDKRQQRD